MKKFNENVNIYDHYEVESKEKGNLWKSFNKKINIYDYEVKKKKKWKILIIVEKFWKEKWRNIGVALPYLHRENFG